MRKFLASLFIFAMGAAAQTHRFPHIDIVTSLPSGACSPANNLEQYAGDVYTCDPSTSTWRILAGSATGGNPAGTSLAVQFNASGIFGGDSNVTLNPGTHVFTAPTVRGNNVSGLTTPEFWGAKGDGTTDDTSAIQSCWNYSSANSVVCQMDPASGTYLVNGQLVIKTRMHVEGKGSPNGTIVKSEFNGDAIKIDTNPVQGVIFRGIHLILDPTLANSRGFHIQGVDGGFGSGGLWDSHFEMVEVDNPAKECLWLDGGTGPGYTFNLPNQFLEFVHFNCGGPAQSHPANLIKITGQVAQTVFIGGQTNGDGSFVTHYLNPLIEVAATFENQGPTSQTFINYTTQNGNVCFDTNESFAIHYQNGYFENCLSAATTSNSEGVTFNDNRLQNVGYGTGNAAFKLNGGAFSASIQRNAVSNDGSHALNGFAICQNQNFANLLGNNDSGTNLDVLSSACVTNQNVISSSTLSVSAPTVYLNGDGGATPISTISSNIQAGQSLTIYAAGNSFVLTTGGNIVFGGYVAPLTIPAGSSVTFKLFDLGLNYIIESVQGGALPGIASQLFSYSSPGLVPHQFTIPSVISTNSGTTPVANGTLNVGTTGIQLGSVCTIVYKASGAGNNYNEIATCQTERGYQTYDSFNTALGSENFTPEFISRAGITSFATSTSIASASVISPTAQIFHVTGTTLINQINIPSSCQNTGFACTLAMIADGAWSLASGVNIATSFSPIVGTTVLVTYDPASGLWYPHSVAVSGQANGVIPLATGATVIGAQSHMDDGATTAGIITSTEPIEVRSSGPSTFNLKPGTFAALTASFPCNGTNEGTLSPVTDSTTATWGATIAGSGANHVLAYCDGTNYTVAAQ